MIDVVCKGSPREMGLAQGQGLRTRIFQARDILARLEAFRQQQPAWMPYRLYRWLAEKKSAGYLNRSLQNHELQERLAGIADGSGVGLPAISLFNAIEPLLSDAGDCTSCPGACSALAIRGSRSINGETIVARNFDYLPLVQPLYVIRDCRPAGKLRSLEFTTAPLAGVVDGMNERGLCILYNYAFTRDKPLAPAPPVSMIISQALSVCSTVQSAGDYISSQPRWGSGLLMLCDQHGDMASLELSNTRSHLRRPSTGDDTLFHSNAFSDASMREVQIADDAVYNNAAPGPLQGKPLHQSSTRRDARFRELLQPQSPVSLHDVEAIMADHGPYGTPNANTICIHSSYWQTTACLQMFPASRTIRASWSTACEPNFVTMGFDD